MILARYVLDGLGLDQDKDFQAIYLDRAGDGPAMVLDGRAAALVGRRLRLAGLHDDGAGAGRRALHRAHGGRDRADPREAFVPESAHDSRPEAIRRKIEPIASVGSWSFVLARPTLDDEVAYRLARALHRGESDLGQKLAQARETTAANTAAAAPNAAMIHPGVAKYLREIGALR